MPMRLAMPRSPRLNRNPAMPSKLSKLQKRKWLMRRDGEQTETVETVDEEGPAEEEAEDEAVETAETSLVTADAAAESFLKDPKRLKLQQSLLIWRMK